MPEETSKYKTEYDEQAFKLCLLGATDIEIADFFGVCEATINNWKLKHPSFLESLKNGKTKADAEVANSLRNRALGYSHVAEKIFNDKGAIVRAQYIEHYPPDTGACMAWLKNRQPNKWRDGKDVNLGGQSDNPVAMTVEIVHADQGNDSPREES